MDEQNQTPQPPQSEPILNQGIQTPPSAPKTGMSKQKLTISIIALVILLLAGTGLGYYIYEQQNSLKTAQNNPGSGNVTVTPTPTADISVTPTPISQDSGVCKNPGPILSSKSGMVKWIKPEPITLSVFATSSTDVLDVTDSSFMVGHFISGKYSGSDLIVTTASIEYEGPGMPAFSYLLIKNQNNHVLLSKYSDPLQDGVRFIVNETEDKDFDISDLDFPSVLHSVSPAADFSLAAQLPFQPSSQTFCADSLVKVFTDAAFGDVYTDASTTRVISYGTAFNKNAFYLKSPDSSLVTYSLNIPFSGIDNVPLVTWTNGQKNKNEYSYQYIGGCGASNYRDVADVNENDLLVIGTAFGGQPIYALKDTNSKMLTDQYSGIYVPDGEKKISYAAFLADHPIFFWKDPFGRFIRFTTKKYQGMAECGKPVIYLYPTETQKTSVQVSPTGGMSKSEPDYNSGWNVISDPLSNIKNLADGKTYPYLFWEGRGGIYETPDKGFVTSKNNVHQFLEEKLSLLGLNEKERKDFEEFWEPKMQSSPYYFVTFMGNSVMDSLAPLSITPKPDTVIRVLMDFKPLEQSITAEGYNIHTPKRKGFTVVEWGGVLR